MKIIIDAMSGDNAPGEIVRGAVSAQKEYGVEIILTGRETELREQLSACDWHGSGIRVVNAAQVIEMAEEPSTAVRTKRDSSMAVGLNLLRDGEGDAFVSAGNTGALLTGATLIVKRIPGIRRACMAPVVPNGNRGALLIDCGANVECSEEYLLQFAYMGSFYAQRVLGCPRPKIGLLNVGTEETKGGTLQKNTYALLQQAAQAGRIHFIGNVESGAVFSGQVDVLVTDGFTGNVMLKTIEGTAKFLMKNIKSALMGSLKAKTGAVLIRNDLSSVKKLLDPNEVGGTPFLGIRRPVIKAHGSSNARAVQNAVRQAMAAVNGGFIEEIEKNIEFMRLRDHAATVIASEGES